MALHGVARTVQYCEIDTTCHLIMEKLFQKGLLHRAPIHPDVCGLSAADVSERVDVVCLGSPCVGFSPTGLRQGFENAQSGLFYEAVRVIKELSPAFIFLENVPNVIKGMREVHLALDDLGYDLRWTMLSAEEVGAPHVRKRWFCLGMLRGDERVRDRTTPLVDPSPHYTEWTHPPSERLCADSKERKLRVGALGNSVVPACVHAAFKYLWDLDLPSSESFKEADNPYPACGCSIGTMVSAIPKPALAGANELLDLTFDPATFKLDKAISVTCKQETILQEPVTRRRWATPRHGMTSACNVLTLRSIRDLPTLARFEVGTVGDRSGQVSPQFCERLMGYPVGWTEYDVPPEAARVVVKRKRTVTKTNTTVRRGVEEDLTGLLQFLRRAPKMTKCLRAYMASIQTQIAAAEEVREENVETQVSAQLVMVNEFTRNESPQGSSPFL